MSAARITQQGVEVFYEFTAASPTTITGVGVSQYGVEVFYRAEEAARVSSYGIEVFYLAPADETGGGGDPDPGGAVTHTFGYAS